jgi:hypothetical protein
MRIPRPTGPGVPRGSGLFVRRARQIMILLLSFRLMRTSPRFVHSVLKIGKGFTPPPEDLTRVFFLGRSLLRHIRRPALA